MNTSAKHSAAASSIVVSSGFRGRTGGCIRALAKKAKPPNKDTSEEGRAKRRKRFVKSIANRAPATFVNILAAKILSHGGRFESISTAAKASQYSHTTRQYKKSKLSQRTKTLEKNDGTQVIIQRDLYSAFLLRTTNETMDRFDQRLCERTFDGFLNAHNRAMEALINVPNLPSSMGMKAMKKAL